MTTRKAFVLGWPIEHSRSPLIHGYWLRQHGLDGGYEKIAIEPAQFRDRLAALYAEGYVGGNVTVPHKQAAFALAETADEMATRLKAANTLVATKTGFAARNTDGEGFLKSLEQSAPAWRAQAGPAVMLGAGGAARAIALALENAGVPELRIVARRPEKAAELIAEIGLDRASAVAWTDREAVLGDAALLVNATSLGMHGQPALEIDLGGLPNMATVADIVYVPLITPLLSAARVRGLAIVDGLGMLLHQAVPGFEAWFGVRPEVTPALRQLVLDDIADH